MVKGTGGELKSEMTDRKHKTGFDRQKINNKRINIQNQFQRWRDNTSGALDALLYASQNGELKEMRRR